MNGTFLLANLFGPVLVDKDQSKIKANKTTFVGKLQNYFYSYSFFLRQITDNPLICCICQEIFPDNDTRTRKPALSSKGASSKMASKKIIKVEGQQSIKELELGGSGQIKFPANTSLCILFFPTTPSASPR